MRHVENEDLEAKVKDIVGNVVADKLEGVVQALIRQQLEERDTGKTKARETHLQEKREKKREKQRAKRQRKKARKKAEREAALEAKAKENIVTVTVTPAATGGKVSSRVSTSRLGGKGDVRIKVEVGEQTVEVPVFNDKTSVCKFNRDKSSFVFSTRSVDHSSGDSSSNLVPSDDIPAKAHPRAGDSGESPKTQVATGSKESTPSSTRRGSSNTTRSDASLKFWPVRAMRDYFDRVSPHEFLAEIMPTLLEEGWVRPGSKGGPQSDEAYELISKYIELGFQQSGGQ